MAITHHICLAIGLDHTILSLAQQLQTSGIKIEMELLTLAVGASMNGYYLDTDGISRIDGDMDKGAVYILNMNADGTVKQSHRINDDTTNGPAI